MLMMHLVYQQEGAKFSSNVQSTTTSYCGHILGSRFGRKTSLGQVMYLNSLVGTFPIIVSLFCVLRGKRADSQAQTQAQHKDERKDFSDNSKILFTYGIGTISICE